MVSIATRSLPLAVLTSMVKPTPLINRNSVPLEAAMRRVFIMQKGVVWLLVLLVLALAAPRQASTAADLTTNPRQTPGAANQDITPKINEYMDALVKAGKFNGSILLAREGRVLVSKGYGMANFELDVPN